LRGPDGPADNESLGNLKEVDAMSSSCGEKSAYRAVKECTLVCGFSLAAQLLPVGAFAQSPSPAQAQSPQAQCAALPVQQLLAGAQKARAPSQIESGVRVLAGGQSVKVKVLAAPDSKEVYCARFEEGGAAVRVVDAADAKSPDDRKRTELTLSVPDLGFGWHRPRQLLVASFPVDANGVLKTESPGVYAAREFPVSNGVSCMLVSLAVVLVAYIAAVLALGRVGGGGYSWDPVYLTSDTKDKASLSQFQIFFFTLIVLWLLTFIALRTGMLSDISLDVLLLLGISAGGTVGSKVADHMKKRLSYENWAWLRNRDWLTAYETGIGQPADAKRARWGDLLKTDGDFDIYSFQLAVFSVVVAYSLVTTGVDQLATFEIPANLKGLLGLSNVVYIGGKAISPNSVGELDLKLTDLRHAELDWFAQVVNVVKPLPDQQAKFDAATAAAPEKSQAYMSLAREIARMLKGLYGRDGTKFKGEPIADSELMPVFP
jgi:hypothetical protein